MSAAPVIGLFGGSFDPIHRAHVEVARRALEQVPCDEVWFLPADRTPFKPEGPRVSAADRIALIEVALAGESGLSVCTVEVGVPGRRSVETVEALQAAHPGTRWRWIFGEDAFESLPQWADPERFARLAPPIVQPRPGSDAERTTTFADAPVTWLSGEPLDVSSTTIREALMRGERPDGLDPRVADRIEELELYRETSR